MITATPFITLQTAPPPPPPPEPIQEDNYDLHPEEPTDDENYDLHPTEEQDTYEMPPAEPVSENISIQREI